MAKLVEVSNPDGFSDLLRKMESALGESAIRKAGAAAASVVIEEARRRVPVGWIQHHQGSKKFPVGFGRDSLLVTFLPEKSVPARQATYAATWAADAYYLQDGSSAILPARYRCDQDGAGLCSEAGIRQGARGGKDWLTKHGTR
jgi:hypothetical protein